MLRKEAYGYFLLCHIHKIFRIYALYRFYMSLYCRYEVGFFVTGV